MNTILNTIISFTTKSNVKLNSIIFININDISLIKESFSEFNNIYAYTLNPRTMRDFQQLIRINRRFKPIYPTEMFKIKEVDVLVCDDFKNINIFNVNNVKYIYLVEKHQDEIASFDKVDENLFVRNLDIVSSSSNWNEKVSLMKIVDVVPISHSYGNHCSIENGKTALISKDEKLIKREAINTPYFEKWVFKKQSPSKIGNMIILENDISDEDMLKIVEIISKAENKKILK